MKTLKAIQVLSKIGKIISTVIFILCIVGFCGCLLGIIGLAAGFAILKFGGITLHNIIEVKANMSMGTLYTILSVSMLYCAGEAVLCKFSEHYFRRELNDGTPFNLDGAKELMRLGILAICIPIGTQILAAIVHAVMAIVMQDVAELDFNMIGSVTIGIGMIVTSLICRHGAELNAATAQASETL